jgi:hypothetical protein
VFSKFSLLLLCRRIPNPDAVVDGFDVQNDERCGVIVPLTSDGIAIMEVRKTHMSTHDDDIACVRVVAILCFGSRRLRLIGVFASLVWLLVFY